MNTVYHNKALPPGTVLREWRLEQVLGVGGFGIVYRGRGIYFDELVAIKEYFPSAISDRKDGDTVVPNDSESEEIHALGLKKFVEEAKLLWNLSKPTRHPNIVSVRSLFEIHGTAYMVMDFEDGISLSQILKDGKRFSEESLLALLRPIAEGLERAHRVGVLHRDIKPANILISGDGRPVLIDFGSARFDSGKATSTKVTFHTPPYAAIEQYVKTYEQGPWTDIYALGVALYECVTGEKPPEVLERLHGGLGQPLSEGEWPGFSKPFLRAIDTAMIIRPNERPQSISQWIAMFDASDEATPAFEPADAPTRFVSFQTFPDNLDWPASPAPTQQPAIEPVAPNPVAPPLPVADSTSAVKMPARKRILVLIAAVVVALCVAAAAIMLRSGQPEEKGASVSTESATASANANLDALRQLHAEVEGLVADSRKAGRSSSEVRALTDAGTKMDVLVAEIDALATKPASAALTERKMSELAGLARTTGHTLAAALANDVNRQGNKLAQSLPWADPAKADAGQSLSSDEQTIASPLRDARKSLDAALATVGSAPGALEAIAATRQAVAAYVQFSAAYAKADNFLIPQRIREFSAVEATARQAAAQVIEMGNSGRPGLFSSREKRDGWRVRKDNASRAQTFLTELNQLAQTARNANSIRKIEQTIAQANTIRRELSKMRATSNAAMPKN